MVWAVTIGFSIHVEQFLMTHPGRTSSILFVRRGIFGRPLLDVHSQSLVGSNTARRALSPTL
tara:strand:- start:1030 stop:1215 length:186 start_codon:yes stop_codon:yes gene_type:complete